MWTPQGKRPLVTVTGSHQKTCVFGTLAVDGKQFFRQYDVFNQHHKVPEGITEEI